VIRNLADIERTANEDIAATERGANFQRVMRKRNVSKISAERAQRETVRGTTCSDRVTQIYRHKDCQETNAWNTCDVSTVARKRQANAPCTRVATHDVRGMTNLPIDIANAEFQTKQRMQHSRWQGVLIIV